MSDLNLRLAPDQRDTLARAVAAQIKNVDRMLASARERVRPLEEALSSTPDPIEARYAVEIDRLQTLAATLEEVRPGELEVGEAFRTVGEAGRVFRVVEVSEDGLTVTARRFGVIGLAEEDRITRFDLGTDPGALRRVFGAAYTG